ncbi:transcription antitermination factor NusB [Corynebacterium sp. TAE3-ERU12]|uniref:transcription antitermination factor NusB n=1 Tax=Corynebacterium sp. TAE3-ERU12 TaxID=2849491 RepID=UPI001C447D91|nr:transcription antitermination factor NusB [Corynebacterium sp. TAE3-ERU12]MBV7295383.1 transcription antitermination factor NusB [Corynebacterium sp. TAE3-ERU12]
MKEANYKRRGARYRARRRAVDLLFEAEQRDVNPIDLVEERIAMSREQHSDIAPVAEYAEQIVVGVATNIDGIDSTIAGYLTEEWPLHRLPAVDRAILRLGIWELFHNPDVPPQVAVVEAVELASEYSTNQAPPYVNAVLDSASGVAEQARAAAAAVAQSLPPQGETTPEVSSDDGAAAEVSSDEAEQPGSQW